MCPHCPAKFRSVKWCELHEDLCGKVVERLDALDVLNFSATCGSWKSVCNRLQTKLIKSGHPTLLSSRPDHDGSRVEKSIEEGTFGLHDISDRKSFCVHSKFLQDKMWIGGKDDWLVVTGIDRCELSLVNLITGESVTLPSLDTIDDAERKENCDLENTYACELYCKRRLRRVVLCQTPSSRFGYIAIAQISVGWIAYTTEWDNAWKLLAHPTNWSDFTYHPFYMDAILYDGKIYAVEGDGTIFAWDMYSHREHPVMISAPNIIEVEEEETSDQVLYLAISPRDELMLICVHGKVPPDYKPSSRMLQSEHDWFEEISGMTVHKFLDSDGTWEQIHNIGLDQSLFVGLNYPFCGTWSGIKPNSVYVSNLAEWDIMVFDMDGAEDAVFQMQDYPVVDDVRLPDGHSMRTPMWFRPTRPSTLL
ncbi:unnamed protein product [Urochloa decumbens]|uniref:F-box domain-containing protein n=1 Tax=Urochloa decumbens TaxID=240449 RepID=A0ABC8ZIM1_9POAL